MTVNEKWTQLPLFTSLFYFCFYSRRKNTQCSLTDCLIWMLNKVCVLSKFYQYLFFVIQQTTAVSTETTEFKNWSSELLSVLECLYFLPSWLWSELLHLQMPCVNPLSRIINICNKLWLFITLWLQSQSDAVELWPDRCWVHLYIIMLCCILTVAHTSWCEKVNSWPPKSFFFNQSSRQHLTAVFESTSQTTGEDQ